MLVEPVEGATEQQSSSPHNADSSLQLLAQADEQLNGHSPPNVAGSSLGCSTHVDNNYTQVRIKIHKRRNTIRALLPCI